MTKQYQTSISSFARMGMLAITLFTGTLWDVGLFFDSKSDRLNANKERTYVSQILDGAKDNDFRLVAENLKNIAVQNYDRMSGGDRGTKSCIIARPLYDLAWDVGVQLVYEDGMGGSSSIWNDFLARERVGRLDKSELESLAQKTLNELNDYSSSKVKYKPTGSLIGSLGIPLSFLWYYLERRKKNELLRGGKE